jgi:Prion-inhibition and propagation
LLAGFRFYNEAAKMPETYQYLRVRMQIEHQRFLDFGTEAGILYTDGVLCESLQVNRSLLLAVLAEIKRLLETYAEVKGRYEEFIVKGDANRKDTGHHETLLTELPWSPGVGSTKGAKDVLEQRGKARLQSVRAIGRSIAQTGRTIRTIALEPKRLVWVAVDKESFESLVLKVEDLNSFLVNLLDRSQIRRLKDIVGTTYLEVLQVRNDIESLKSLVKALESADERQEDVQARIFPIVPGPLTAAFYREVAAHRKEKLYLRQLAEIKIQHNEMQQRSSDTLSSSKRSVFTGTRLEMDKIRLDVNVSELYHMPHRTTAEYQDADIWIEWRDTPEHGLCQSNVRARNRIGLLTDFLRFEKPDSFRAPPCLGFVEATGNDNQIQFGVVFEKPKDTPGELQTLRDLIEQYQKPSLDSRMLLCAVLARCVHSFHAVNWLHKGLRADNVIFFPPSAVRLSLDAPYVSGFELSRPSIIEAMTEKPVFDPLQDIYRHPDAQSSQTDGNYCKSYDIYSLGILFTEIATWKHIEDIVGLDGLKKANPSALKNIQSILLQSSTHVRATPRLDTRSCLQQVASECGDSYRLIVERCLTARSIEEPRYTGESESSTAVRLQTIMEEDIVKVLEHMSQALHGLA